jgi:hypothetical protein
MHVHIRMIDFPVLMFCVLLLVASTVLGVTLSLCLGYEVTELSWLTGNRVSLSVVVMYAPLIGLWQSGCNGVTLLMLLMVGIGFVYSIYSTNSLDVMSVLVCHYLFSLSLCYLSISGNSFVYIVGSLLILDVLSVLQVCLIPGTGDRVGAWYYLLYQAFLTMLPWLSLCLGGYSWMCMFWFLKLGGGITGFYLPSLYRSLSATEGMLMYVGSVTIFQGWCSYMLLVDLLDGVAQTWHVVLMVVWMLVVLMYWSYNMDWLLSVCLYGLCVSTLLTLGSVSVILLCGSAGLFMKGLLGGFLLMSQCSWCMLVCGGNVS